MDRLIRFLLIEDDPDHALLIQRSFEMSRIANELDHVPTAADALRLLRGQGTQSRLPLPDVILLDLNLPMISGCELLAILKADPVLKMIPVVMLTTSNAEADRQRAYKAGAASFLTKPVDFDKFQAMVEELNLYWGIWNQPAFDQPQKQAASQIDAA